jgi:hypothetical protein
VRELVDCLIVPLLLERFLREHRAVVSSEPGSHIETECSIPA